MTNLQGVHMETYTDESNLSQAIPKPAEDPQAVTGDGDGAAWNADLEQRISERAYHIYLERGGNGGDPLNDWLQAEAEICGSSQGLDETEGVNAVDGESAESYGTSAGGL
jgi:hypothetical protein